MSLRLTLHRRRHKAVAALMITAIGDAMDDDVEFVASLQLSNTSRAAFFVNSSQQIKLRGGMPGREWSYSLNDPSLSCKISTAAPRAETSIWKRLSRFAMFVWRPERTTWTITWTASNEISKTCDASVRILWDSWRSKIRNHKQQCFVKIGNQLSDQKWKLLCSW